MSSPSSKTHQNQTPTLSSLLQLRPSTTGQSYGNGGNGAGPEPAPAVYSNMPTTADAYWTQQERYPNAKGPSLTNNYPAFANDSTTSFKHMPPMGGYGPGTFNPQQQQRHAYPSSSNQGGNVPPNYNLQQPYGPQGNYTGQSARSSSYGVDQESMPNGATSSPKINVNSTTTGSMDNLTHQQQQFQPGGGGGSSTASSVKHPTVAALKQEYPGSSPGSARSASPSSSNCTTTTTATGAPNSPTSHMRHSPVSPTPVSVYQTGCYSSNQSHTVVNPQFANFQSFAGGGSQQTAHSSSLNNDGFANNNLTSSSYQQPLYPGYAASGVYTNGPSALPNTSYASQPMPGGRFRSPPMAPVANGPYAPPMSDVYNSRPPGHQQFYNSPGRPPPPMNAGRAMTNGPTSFNERLDSPAVSDVDTRDSAHSNGTPIGDRPRTSTPATPSVGRTKMNGSKESHPSTPAPASPGGASSIPDDLDSSLSSPSWPRTPMSPAGTGGRYLPMNSQPPSMGPPAPVVSSSPSTSGVHAPSSSLATPTHKESGLSLVQRLLGDFHQNQYTMQEYDDRRRFYERLVQFCETKGHPLTGQPTVSKQTVDLYRLYMSVKQNGGFEQVTKRKSWRELCTVFSIGQSNSASGQLKKQYAKILLPFECFYDLGDIDPGPILTACESKKKGKNKSAGSAAAQTYPDSLMGPPNSSYGSHTTLDSQVPNANVPYLTNSGYAPNAPQNRYAGAAQQQQAGNETVVNNPFDDRTSVQQQQTMYSPAAPTAPYGQRTQTYSNYPPPQNSTYDGGYHHPSATQQPPPNVAGGNRTNANYPSSNSNSSYPTPPTSSSASVPSVGYETNSSTTNTNVILAPNQYLMPSNDVRRNNNNNNAVPIANQLSTSSSSVESPASSSSSSHVATAHHQTPHVSQQQSNFHPQDAYVGVQNTSSPAAAVYYQQQRSISNHQNADNNFQPPPANGPQKHTYGPGPELIGQQQSYTKSWIQNSSKYAPIQQSSGLNTPNLPGNIAKDPRFYNTTPPQFSHRYAAPPYLHTGEVPIKSVASSSYGPPMSLHRKEISPVSCFPPQSVESTIPFVKRRRKLYARDLGKIDAWRVVMALKSGLAYETAWALNALNVLLYDDNSATFFGLSNLPALLDTLVDLFRRTLSEILSDCSEFDCFVDEEVAYETVISTDETSIEYVLKTTVACSSSSEETPKKSKARSFFLASDANATTNLNFTMTTRKGKRVKFVSPSIKIDPDDSTTYDVRPLQEYEEEFWQLGGSNSTEHLRTKFDESIDDFRKHQFFRSISAKKNNTNNSSLTSNERKRKCCSLDADDCDEKRVKFTSGNDDSNCRCATTNEKVETEECKNQSSSTFFYTNVNGKKYENDEVFTHNKPPVKVSLQFKTSAVERCVCLSNILRGLSFVPGNDTIMAKHAALIRTLASLLLLGHRHVERRRTPCKPSTVEDIDAMTVDDEPTDAELIAGGNKETFLVEENCNDGEDEGLWFYDEALVLVDDAFVILCNLSASLDLFNHQENVARPVIDSLLHWAVCRSPTSQDPLLSWSSVTPERYALEILCKLSVIERNVDLILATPPWDRLETLIEQLVAYLCGGEETVLREFAVVLIHTFCCASPVACVVSALRTSVVQYLVSFLEIADSEMHRVVQYHGMQTLRDNPEVIGTSVGMLRRAAGALLAMTKVPACHIRFYRHQLRLLNFTMSHLMDSRVGATIAEALYEIQKEMAASSEAKNALDSGNNGNDTTSSSSSQENQQRNEQEQQQETENNDDDANAVTTGEPETDTPSTVDGCVETNNVTADVVENVDNETGKKNGDDDDDDPPPDESNVAEETTKIKSD